MIEMVAARTMSELLTEPPLPMMQVQASARRPTCTALGGSSRSIRRTTPAASRREGMYGYVVALRSIVTAILRIIYTA